MEVPKLRNSSSLEIKHGRMFYSSLSLLLNRPPAYRKIHITTESSRKCFLFLVSSLVLLGQTTLNDVVIYMMATVHVFLNLNARMDRHNPNKIFIVIRIGSANKRTTEVKCEYMTLESPSILSVCCVWPSAKK